MPVQLIKDNKGRRGFQARATWQSMPGLTRYFSVAKFGYRNAKNMAEAAERDLVRAMAVTEVKRKEHRSKR